MTLRTGTPVTKEKPKSPVRAFFNHTRYWMGTGLSRPKRIVMASLAVAVMRGLKRTCCGPPGIRWIRANIKMETRRSRGIACRIRLMIYRPINTSGVVKMRRQDSERQDVEDSVH